MIPHNYLLVKGNHLNCSLTEVVNCGTITAQMSIDEHMLQVSDDPDLTKEGLNHIILGEAVDSLPLDQQAVLALDVVGFRQWEISNILGISRTTVWSKKTQALTSLKELLLDE